ncbi:Uncharacterised protein [Mycobacteroides abscessus subsp. abscessus]|nr:Uncharacterised protein [Mycobacteroides abscessus subsp. abscessus]
MMRVVKGSMVSLFFLRENPDFFLTGFVPASSLSASTLPLERSKFPSVGNIFISYQQILILHFREFQQRDIFVYKLFIAKAESVC